ncbi:hypothetical protein ACN20G_02445 [Streptomyces sp. BI20]|uniref:hypothetical protein n=1 Tax=Streptomyces sp. BI20 TaxID=3403460 RepID=UPI003C74E11F
MPPHRPTAARPRPPRSPFRSPRRPGPVAGRLGRAAAGGPGSVAWPWLLCAAWALSFPLFSSLGPHRLWGLCAGSGYLLAAACAHRIPRAVLPAALTGAVLVPMLWLVATGQGQSEVAVIERAGVLTVAGGTPWLPDPVSVAEYTPYLPAVALFGLPRALFGDGGGLGEPWATVARVLGDARLWCAAVFFAGFLAAGRPPGPGERPGGRGPTVGGDGRGWALALVASPLVALPMTVSGVDLPSIGLCVFALAAVGAGRPGRAGLALAVVCATKWILWPVLPVALALAAATGGRRAAARCGASAMLGTAALVAPAALLAPGELWRQVVEFPTGRAVVATPASSPMPGRLLAQALPGGWWLAAGLVACGALAVGLSLVLRPPRDPGAAALRLALGLAVAFLGAPTGRWGYLAVPVLLALWGWTARGPDGPVPAPAIDGGRAVSAGGPSRAGG